jgi:hypothetical protein
MALAALVLGACGDGETIQCDFTGSASAVVGGGTAQTGFLALQSGAPMEVTLGPQGLYMVTPSVRVQNMYPGESGRTGNANDPEISFEVHMGGSLIGGSAREYLGLTASAGGAERLGVFTPFTADRSQYIGQLVTVSVQVKDACGRSAGGTLDVTAQ